MRQDGRNRHRYPVWKFLPVCLFSLLFSVLITGCVLGPPALKASFVDYSSAYADVSNRQMLLNLARTANYHPPYFLQLANITTTFQLGAEASAGAEAGRQRPEGTKITEVGAEAGLGGSYGEQPTFDFTPLSGQSFAEVVLSPIPRNVFFALYEQGFPADMLVRGLVLSVTFEFPESGRRVTLNNIPDLDRPQRFLDFLRLAAIMRELQLEQALFVACHRRLAPQVDAMYITVHRGVTVDNIGELLVPLFEYDIPTFAQPTSKYVARGVLFSISRANWRFESAFYARTLARILNGALPRELPQVFEAPPKIAINLATAERIGYEPPIAVLGLADEIYMEIEEQTTADELASR